MDRKNFIKSAVVGLSSLFFSNKVIAEIDSKKKYGFLHIANMNRTKGIRPGDIKIIDKKTGSLIQFDPRENWVDDGKPVVTYAIQYVDDVQGIVGGEIIRYEYWKKGEGVGPHLKEQFRQHFYEERDIIIEINKERWKNFGKKTLKDENNDFSLKQAIDLGLI